MKDSEGGGSEGGSEEGTLPDNRTRSFRTRLRAVRHVFNTRLRAYFIAGVLVTAPITITVWLAWEIVGFFDAQVQSLLPAQYNPEHYLPFTIPGIGLLVFILAVTLIGALTAGLIGRTALSLGERVLAKMPVIRTVYGALKQIFETVLAHKSEAFRQVVLFEYPRRGIWCMGFVSGRTEGEVQNLTEDEVVNVFLPTTPNPTSGFLLFVPKKDLVILDMSVEDGIKMVVSGGIVTPPDRRSEEQKAQPGFPLRDTVRRAAADEEAAFARAAERQPERI